MQGTVAIFTKIRDAITSNQALLGLTLSILVGVIAGFGAVGFRGMIKFVQSFFFGTVAGWFSFMGDYYVILLPAIGGLVVGLVVYFGAREARGHGVPEVIEAVALRGGKIRPRVALVKIIASAVCIGSGGSVGREGPIVQIGSSAASAIGQWFRLPANWMRTLVACGAAGGISATFNTPLAGVFFAMEVILGRFMTPHLGYVFLSAVAASIISHIYLGDVPAFIVPAYGMISNWEVLSYALLGIVAALAAIAFVKLLYFSENAFDRLAIPDYVKPFIGGIGVGLIGLYSLDLLGVGYGDVFWVNQMSIDQVLMGQLALGTLGILALLKIVATSLTLGSGGSGGIFAPALFIGAMVGGLFGSVAHGVFPDVMGASGAYAVVGMAALFAAATRAPITAVIAVFELTQDYQIVLPTVLAVMVATLASKILMSETIYTQKLIQRGIDVRQLYQTSPMKKVTVASVMTRDVATILATMSLVDLMERFRRTANHGFPVVDEGGSLYGMVTLTDVENAVKDQDYGSLTVADIAATSLVVAYPDQTLHELLERMGASEMGRIPVVDRNNPKRLLGILRRRDILRAYTKVPPGSS